MVVINIMPPLYKKFLSQRTEFNCFKDHAFKMTSLRLRSNSAVGISIVFRYLPRVLSFEFCVRTETLMPSAMLL